MFTGDALRRGIEVLVSHFAPRGTPKTPISVKEAAAKIAKMMAMLGRLIAAQPASARLRPAT